MALPARVSHPEDSLIRGPVHEMALEGPCPACGRTTVRMRSLSLALPYFGEAVQTTVLCTSCGFRHADVALTGQREPTRVELRVTTRDHLDARVARSASGTIRIPEIEASMEPGPRSEAFISNVEGFLHRFRDIARSALAMAADSGERAAAESSVARLEALIDGRAPFTIIIDDPTGNSDIFHGDVQRRRLTPEEIADLHTPEVAFDLADIVEGAPTDE